MGRYHVLKSLVSIMKNLHEEAVCLTCVFCQYRAISVRVAKPIVLEECRAIRTTASKDLVAFLRVFGSPGRSVNRSNHAAICWLA
jgi:hypothetical protein